MLYIDVGIGKSQTTNRELINIPYITRCLNFTSLQYKREHQHYNFTTVKILKSASCFFLCRYYTCNFFVIIIDHNSEFINGHETISMFFIKDQHVNILSSRYTEPFLILFLIMLLFSHYLLCHAHQNLSHEFGLIC